MFEVVLLLEMQYTQNSGFSMANPQQLTEHSLKGFFILHSSVLNITLKTESFIQLLFKMPVTRLGIKI